jgi:hypothetical protein
VPNHAANAPDPSREGERPSSARPARAASFGAGDADRRVLGRAARHDPLPNGKRA